jgi:membrane-bound lytic murein transglycosylase A
VRTRPALASCLAAVLSWLSAFAALESPPSLVEVSVEELPEFPDDLDSASLVEALSRNLDALARRRPEDPVAVGEIACRLGDLRAVLSDLREVVGSGSDPAEYVRARFRVFRTATSVLVTGYYEPVLEARRRREGRFIHPIYRRPNDLVEIRLAEVANDPTAPTVVGRVAGGQLEPYLSRREIDGERALEGRGLELAWLSDEIELYFLHVQGSGVLRFEDGRETRIGYGGSNGKGYTSIGRLLRTEGALAPGESTAPGIRRYLRSHPERVHEILFANERYVFFREVTDGPVGSLGARLTAGRSIATDPGFVPPGALAFLETRVPKLSLDGEAVGARVLRRFVVSQDTGAAITGPGRVDLFFGTGERAGLEAGHMSGGGELYVFFPVCDPVPVSSAAGGR